jgi:transcriptional regulator GlxA family with amidase domain
MRVVHEFPRIPAFVLLTRSGTPTAADLLALGNCGIQHLVDVRTPDGWNRLRETLAADVAHERDAEVAAELALDLQETPVDFSRFVQALFTDNERPRTVRTLAAGLGVLPSTLMSRFFRAGLPAPKRYLAYAGLVRAARMLENPGLSIADVAYRLNHSSPQSFGRHIFTFMKLSAGEFRRTHDGVRMMQRFREELIAPYRERIAWVSPLIMRPRGMRPKLPAALH